MIEKGVGVGAIAWEASSLMKCYLGLVLVVHLT